MNPLLKFARRLSAAAHRRISSGESARPARRRDSESGFALLFALGLVGVMVALSLVVLEVGATQNRRAKEEEAIWRGNQYVRAIRLYYHKTGKYPQTIDDLTKGLPELHFLRQQYKNPMDPAEGAWRFIYVNQAGQIIGSTRYATLQQMALLDLNGGAMPGTQQIPGQPGIPVSALSNSGSNSDSSGQTPTSGTGTNPANGTTNGTGAQDPNAPNGQLPGQDPNQPTSGQPPLTGQNPQSPGGAFGGAGGILGGQAPTSTTSLLSGASGQTNVAALTALKPTGPVDGPVLGGFLTGVGATGDRKSQKVYHGGKKYIDWEFIWNPLEDAAAAQQQGASGQGGILGGSLPGATGAPGSSPSSGSSFNNSGSSFGPSSGGQQPSQPQTPPQ
ncbi:MAG TPA: hypothetical protein VGD60_10190 [Candidatus Acidoferrales bacterium]